MELNFGLLEIYNTYWAKLNGGMFRKLSLRLKLGSGSEREMKYKKKWDLKS